MKFLIFSDIHLEYNRDFLSENIDLFLDNKDNTIILCGDIGYPKSNEYTDFLNIMSNSFKYVIFITGNHEYYNSEYYSINTYLEEFCKKYNNVYFLNNSFIIIDDIQIIGSTLWSNINKYLYIEDYKKIKIGENNLDYNSYIKLYNESVKYLESILLSDKKYNRIVVTHHLPSIKLIDNNYMYSNNSSYYSDLSRLFKYVDYWVCGHSHTYKKIIIENCTLLLNPIGYPEEYKNNKNKNNNKENKIII